jgi:MFS transporter, UMF1 family
MASVSRKTYPDQDNRLTSVREILAWYSYCFASEVYAVVSLSTNLYGQRLIPATYIPVTLEQLASEKGVLFSDLTTPCRPTGPSDHPVLPRFENGERCVFKLFGLWWVDTASFALYVFSLSVLLQALVVISMSGAADHGSLASKENLMTGRHRKNLLVAFAMIGSVTCMFFAAVGKGGALWAGLLAIIGNVYIVSRNHVKC